MAQGIKVESLSQTVELKTSVALPLIALVLAGAAITAGWTSRQSPSSISICGQLTDQCSTVNKSMIGDNDTEVVRTVEILFIGLLTSRLELSIM